MYRKILVALENSRADESLIPHIKELARTLHSELYLVHVADGWVARNFDQLKLAESDEMKQDREYLETIGSQLRKEGLAVTAHVALGDPASEILKTAERQNCDLIAMTTHGHRFVSDLVRGSTIAEVRHRATIPILLVRAAKL
ncbi:MAG: universal stress protein [Verrucomicrobiota bacterium]